MNPEINIKISFGNVGGQVIVEEESTDHKKTVGSDGEMEAPTVVGDISTMEEIPEIPSIPSDSNGILTVPEFDDDSDEAGNDFAAPTAEEDQTDISEIASVPMDEDENMIDAPMTEDVTSDMAAPEALQEEFVDFETNIPPIPEQDFSDAVEMQILAQLDDLDTDLEAGSVQFDVPNGFQIGDTSVNDESIPPIPDV